jgi:hypothetical protein
MKATDPAGSKRNESFELDASTVEALNAATPEHFEAVAESVRYRAHPGSVRVSAAALIKDVGAIFEDVGEGFSPSLFLVALSGSVDVTDLRASGLSDEAVAAVHRLQLTLGRVVWDLLVRGSEGGEDWMSYSVQAEAQSNEQGGTRKRVTLRIHRNDGSELLLNTSAPSLLRLIARLLGSLTRLPQELLDESGPEDLAQVAQSLQHLKAHLNSNATEARTSR